MTKEEREFLKLQNDIRKYLRKIEDKNLTFEDINDIKKQQLINLRNKLRDILY